MTVCEFTADIFVGSYCNDVTINFLQLSESLVRDGVASYIEKWSRTQKKILSGNSLDSFCLCKMELIKDWKK